MHIGYWFITVVCGLLSILLATKGPKRTYVLFHVIFLTIPSVMFSMFLTSFQSKENLKKLNTNGSITQISSRIWTCDGNSKLNFPVTMTIVKSRKDNHLAIFSGLSCTDETIEQVKKIGTVDLIVIPTSEHNAHALSWKKHFPDARISVPAICQSVCEKALTKKNEGIEVKTTTHDESFGKYEIKIHKDSKQNVLGDAVYELELEFDGLRNVLMFTHLQVNLPNYIKPIYNGWLFRIGGWGGFQRTAILYQAFFQGAESKDLLINKIANIPNVDVVIFAHGGAQRSTYENSLTENVRKAALQL